jgi:hypothetical protein
MMVIPAEQFCQLDNTGDEYLILIGARSEPAGNPRNGTKGEVVDKNNYAIKHRNKIKVPAAKYQPPMSAIKQISIVGSPRPSLPR